MPDGRRLPEGLTPRLLNRDEAALYLGVSGNHFDKHVSNAVPAVMIGCRRLYDIRALDRFVDGCAKPGNAPSKTDKQKALEALDGNQNEGRQASSR